MTIDEQIAELELELEELNTAIKSTLKRGEKFGAGASQGTGATFAFTPLKDLYASRKAVKNEIAILKKGLRCSI